MNNSVIEVKDLQVHFFIQNRSIIAVDNISFNLKKGETLGIVGESGSGKSVTSLAIMNLIYPPGKVTNGQILFRPENDSDLIDLLRIDEQEKRLFRGGKIAMIFQEPMSSLNPVYNIGFQITEAILLHENISQAEARRRAIALLQEVKLLASNEQLKAQCLAEFPKFSQPEINQFINQQKQNFLKRFPHELSGGQLQRVMIAMAISCNPVLLIADEPTTALDVTVQATILNLLKELCKSRQMSLIFITHDLGVIAELVDQVAVMYQGKIVEIGSIKDVFCQPKHPYTKGLLACRPRLDQHLKILPTVSDFMEVETKEDGKIVIKEKEFKPENLEININNNRENIHENKPLLSIKNLHVGFPLNKIWGQKRRYFMAVNNVSFDLFAGETLGLVGESGCGKSTLARTILRLINPLQGEIIFRENDLAKWNINDKKLRNLRREMQIVFQNPYNSLNPRMTIGNTILEPMIIHNTGGNKKKRQERVAYLLERVGLNANYMNRYPHEFSGGQRQRICIARALALNPQFIICDESVSALDVSVQAQVLNLLKELQAEFGLTYIFISHDLSVVKFMSDRIIVMNKGRIEETGRAEEIYKNPSQEYTRQLIASIPKGEFKNSN
jgi:peptide/nickel transport system ATP-binding protein